MIQRFDIRHCKIKIVSQIIIALSNMEKVNCYCWWQSLINLEYFCGNSLQVSSMDGNRSIFFEYFCKRWCLVTVYKDDVLSLYAPYTMSLYTLYTVYTMFPMHLFSTPWVFMQLMNLVMHCTAIQHPSRWTIYIEIKKERIHRQFF